MAGLSKKAEDYPYSSAFREAVVDDAPPWLKPYSEKQSPMWPLKGRLNSSIERVEQAFRPAARSGRMRLQPLRCRLTIPHRGATSESAYFVTANVFDRKSLFQVDKIARLFIEVLLDYRAQKKYLVHEFVVMPDHFHLILTPTGITLERASQFVKGGFSFRLNRNLKVKRDVWQASFVDRRIRDSLEYARYKDYIWQNPVKRRLAKSPEEYAYSSANPSFKLDPVPQWLKPVSLTTFPQA